MLGHKKCFSKFETTEIILSILPDHKTMKLEVNYNTKKKTLQKPTKTWRLNSIFLTTMDHWRNQRRNKKYLETNENENTTNVSLHVPTVSGPRGMHTVFILFEAVYFLVWLFLTLRQNTPGAKPTINTKISLRGRHLQGSFWPEYFY